MKTAYKFDSKHLGQAFMKELEEMGYKQESFYEFGSKSLMICTENNLTSSYRHDNTDASTIFTLEFQWNEALAHAREQLKPEFKEGDWVAGCYGDREYLMVWNDGKPTYGFYQGGWNNTWSCSNNIKDQLRKATPEEVEQALIKEAKRRGYSEQTQIKSFMGGMSALKKSEQTYYDSKRDRLTYMGSYVYQQGEWAEIIDNKFFDWEVTKSPHSNHKKIGCKHISNDDILALKNLLPYVKDKTVKEVLTELKKL